MTMSSHVAHVWCCHLCHLADARRRTYVLDYKRERGPLAAVDAVNRSLRKGSTPPGPHVVMDLPRPCAARRLATARGLW
jgi:hypothetical protein